MKPIKILIAKYNKASFIAFVVFLIFGTSLFILRKDIEGKTFHILISMIFLYYAYHRWKMHGYNNFSVGIILGLASLFTLTIFNQTYLAIRSTEQFDFMCFYMQGQLGLHNLPFYDPESFKVLLDTVKYPFTFQSGIKAEILDVGMLSPPITMLLFTPLTYFDYETSKIIFSLSILVFIFLNAYLANTIFVKSEKSLISFLFILIIIILNPATSNTIAYLQTNFFILFFILLIYKNIEKPSAGIFLALSVIFKPITGILILYFLFNSRWKSVLYFSIMSLLLLLLTISFWGIDNIISFLASPPNQRLPQDLYVQGINQSLIAIFNRNLATYGIAYETINILYFIVTGAITFITIFASMKIAKYNLRLAFLPFIPLMLIVYPSSLSHYAVYLSLIILHFILLPNGEKYFWIILVPAISFINNEAFFAYLFVWTILVYFGTRNKIFEKSFDLFGGFRDAKL